jgi:hypothetical protein
MSVFPEGLEPVSGLEPAAWVHEALKGWPAERFRVRDLVPPVFEAYARILHETQIEDRGRLRAGTWAARAAALRRALGPETTWSDIGVAPFDGGMDPPTPLEGSLSEREVAILCALLERVTSDPRACWFGLWSGFGFLTPGGASYLRVPETLRERWARRRIRRAERKAGREAERALARLTTFDLLGHSGRAYLLMRGAVADARRFLFDSRFQSPTLWWPEDRAWFVHTEIDAMSTYLGGSRALIDRLVGEQVLESFEIQPDTLAAL